MKEGSLEYYLLHGGVFRKTFVGKLGGKFRRYTPVHIQDKVSFDESHNTVGLGVRLVENDIPKNIQKRREKLATVPRLYPTHPHTDYWVPLTDHMGDELS